MKNNVLTIVKKEFARFFGDKRMVFTTILMPGLLIYVMYTFMGEGLSGQFQTGEGYVCRMQIENLPDSLAMMKDMEEVSITEIEAGQAEEAKTLLQNEEIDLLVCFPEDFDASVASYDVTTAEPAPNVAIYYNSVSTESSSAYDIMEMVLGEYESSLSNRFDINSDGENYDVASKEDQTTFMVSMLLPMLIMVFVFSGCMAISAEAIAGEKERGTIATLLITPMKRSELALGKILSLSIIGLLSGVSSFIGTMLSFPKIMGGTENMDISSVYTVSDYALLLLVILAVTLVIVGAISVISALAKSIKEASAAVMPLMILVMLISLSSMMGLSVPTEFYWYLIPLYNSVQSMAGIFSQNYTIANILIATAANIVYTGVLVGLLTKLFNSERIMYN